MIYDANGNEINFVYDVSGDVLGAAYDADGVLIWQAPNPVCMISQIGYDADKNKRATCLYIPNGTEFTINDASDDSVVYTGTVFNQIADFSTFEDIGEYYITINEITSYPFKIGRNRIHSVTALPALKFMEMSRQDAWNVGGNTGYAWRDGHQFSFELNSLVMQYMANPTYYNALTQDVYNVALTEYEDLRVQDCPNIIWLMKFAIMRYYEWNTNDDIDLHALIKGQIAYFLYIYPYITDYIDSEWYQTVRDWAIDIWSVTTCNKSWYEVTGGINHNLFETQNKIGTVKGQLPPGYAIVPNLMMYEVCKRDGLSAANNFMTAAENNIAWLVNSVDLTDPVNTKGQRMNEYITFHALTYAYEMYPEHCPSGTYNKIVNAAENLISLSNNMWDYTKYNESRWVNLETSGGLCNNPGYVGMMGVYFALARVINDTAIKARLIELAVAHHDHGFGRNPLGRCFDYKATDDFDGAKLNWVSRYPGGHGALGSCVGVLDGSPKEENFPYNPDGSTGYTEGWVAFNSAWNMGLAYLSGEKNNGIGIFAASKTQIYYAVGDSIVENSGTKLNPVTVGNEVIYGYTQAIEDRYNMVCTNYGNGGHTIVQDLNALRNIDYSNVTLVTIGYGVNDGRLNVPLGQKDSSDTSTFAGALGSLITKIQSDNRKCHILILTPIQRKYVNGWGSYTQNSNGDTLEDFAEMCKSVGIYYSVQCVDLFHNSGINETNIDELTVDGVHPRNSGYVRMTNTIIPFTDDIFSS